ncbi:LLM class flavin-dependent oxidoreductase [Naumannella halotolerans]|uniref:Luciferase family oxidoreductase group 1 n=1 Tax=Naumannella halotolerans TaxID=993414 RepID=A0A4R7IYR3_9ACTN|nr:LLM class flavin-dependent oxidoreductase [Naumannella halotolerans]TDT29921.1 luciferase family oxidoreductase group 1 [Naumannella halotolerans]
MSKDLSLSVLDLMPVRTGQTTADSLAASVELAQAADRLGYTRYWVAEHHNMPAVAATNPPVSIALLAARTERIRVGSGGVMLPNHTPLVIAEQFALLEAAFPGRIDLGIGRAPGSDPVTSYALRQGRGNDAVAEFDAYVNDIIAWLEPEGVELGVGGRRYALRATPAATSAPPVWLLGSSDYSARLAAKLGLPYVFAHHFAGEGTGQALDLYRSLFTPGVTSAPRTFLTVNAVVAKTEAEAIAQARPNLLSMLALRTNQPMRPQLNIDEALQTQIPPAHQVLADAMSDKWLIGTADQVAGRLQELAERYDVDEVMIHPVAGADAATDPRRSPNRVQTLELLGQALHRETAATH